MGFYELDRKKFPTCIGAICDTCGSKSSVNHNYIPFSALMTNGKYKCEGCRMKAKKKQIVWVYEDSDHGDIEVFRTFKQAKKYAEEQWPDVEWFSEDKNGCSDDNYVHVSKKVVK